MSRIVTPRIVRPRIATAIAATLLVAAPLPASAALIIVTYTGVTSTAEGAYIRTQDFLTGGTPVYSRGPVYDDVVSGRFTIDTDRMPPYDEDGFLFGQYVYETRLPDPGFGTSTFTSTGNIPAASSDQTASLFFPRAGDFFGQLAIGDERATVIDDAVDRADGTVAIHRERLGDAWGNMLGWKQELPILTIDGVAIPDFGKITTGSFGSYHISNRYIADEVAEGSADGPTLSRTVSRWDTTHNRSSGVITSIAMEIRAVPEPASWTMMIAGFALVGGALRRARGVSRLADGGR